MSRSIDTTISTVSLEKKGGKENLTPEEESPQKGALTSARSNYAPQPSGFFHFALLRRRKGQTALSARGTRKENIQGPPFSRSHIPRILLWVSVVNERCKNTWIEENINPSIYLSIVYIDRNR